MDRRLLGVSLVAAFLVSIAAPEGSAQPKTQTCKDVPVTFWFDATRTGADPQTVLQNAIQNDNGGGYTDGVGGVSAVLNTCNGTNNLTVDTGKKGRTFVYSLPPAVPGSSAANPPQYGNLGGTMMSVDTLVFFRNILYNRPACGGERGPYTFTTDAFFGFPSGAGGYRLRFVGPNDADLRWPANQFPDDQLNFEPSNVAVTFHPGDCDTVPDSWTISGYNPSRDGYLELGTLHQLVKSKWVHQGQYEMPFRLHVVARVVF